MKAAGMLILVSLALGTAAVAQEAAAPAAAAQIAAVSDEEVGRFARAALAVEQIAADAALDATQKKAAMKNAVEQAGFERQRFNEIARASQADAARQARIQAAAAAQVEPATPTRRLAARQQRVGVDRGRRLPPRRVRRGAQDREMEVRPVGAGVAARSDRAE